MFSSSAFAGTYSGGTGEPNDPYIIATAEDMNEIGDDSNDWDAHFLLVADINLADYTGTQFNIIGYFFDEHSYKLFTGVFDGNGHSISNFTYTTTDTDCIGIFGYVNGPNAEIKDLSLIDPNIDGGTGTCIGSLVGYMDGGTITRCYVERGDVSGDEFVGGFIGLNRGTVIRCYVLSSNVSGSYYTGGFVGENYYGTISQCFSTGSITGDEYIGGMVGVNVDNSLISNCYSTADVSGYSNVGGLVGINGGTISNCYAAGAVDGNDYTGGLVGSNYYGTILASFWDVNTSGQATSAGGTPKTTTEMKTESTFTNAGWDFIEIWDIGENQTYPFLRTHLAGDINHDDIVNFYDLAIIADHWLQGAE